MRRTLSPDGQGPIRSPHEKSPGALARQLLGKCGVNNNVVGVAPTQRRAYRLEFGPAGHHEQTLHPAQDLLISANHAPVEIAENRGTLSVDEAPGDDAQSAFRAIVRYVRLCREVELNHMSVEGAGAERVDRLVAIQTTV